MHSFWIIRHPNGRPYIDAFFSNIHWQTVEQRLSLPARAYKATG